MNLIEPIVFEHTAVTKFHKTELRKSCPVRAVLHRSPKLQFSIESNKFPTFILRDCFQKSFNLVLENGVKIKVRIKQMKEISNSCFNGSLALEVAPCQVADPKFLLQSARFEVVNFSKFYGAQDQLDQIKNSSRRLGRVKLVTECGWKIVIKEVPIYGAQKSAEEQESDYVITHEGVIDRSDGNQFSVAEATNLVNCLEYYFSFLRGKRCGLVCVTGVSTDGNRISLIWGSKIFEPWVKDVYLLFGLVRGGDRVSTTFPEFWKLFESEDWSKDLRRTIDLYLNSQYFDMETGIVLSQAALELLSSKIIRNKKNSNHGKPVIYLLRESLKQLSINTNIPPFFKELKIFAQQKGWDAPKVITRIRNDIIHPDQRLEISSNVMIETHKMCLWYIEMILLRKLNFQGEYWNRYISENESPYCKVP